MILFLCFSDISYANVFKPKRIYLRNFQNQTAKEIHRIRLSKLNEYLEKGVKSLQEKEEEISD